MPVRLGDGSLGIMHRLLHRSKGPRTTVSSRGPVAMDQEAVPEGIPSSDLPVPQHIPEPLDDTSYPSYGEVRALPQRRGSRREVRTDRLPQLLSRTRRMHAVEEQSEMNGVEKRKHKMSFPFRRRHGDARAQPATDSRDEKESPTETYMPTPSDPMADQHDPTVEAGIRRSRQGMAVILSGPLLQIPSSENEADGVAEQITEFCYNDPSADDGDIVHELGDWIMASETRSKAAVRVLRHLLKAPSVPVQSRAVRAWGVWTMLGGGNFSTYAVSPTLLATLEDLLNNSLTHPQLRKDILMVVAALAHRAQHMDRLYKIGRLWVRVHPNDLPETGIPLAGPLFCDQPTALTDDTMENSVTAGDRPQAPVARHALPSVLQARQTPPRSRPDGVHRRSPLPLPPGPTGGLLAVPSSPPSSTSTLSKSTSRLTNLSSHTSVSSLDADDEKHVREVRRDCDVAHTNATMLIQALTVDDLHSERVTLCRTKASESHMRLESHLAWATVWADRPDDDIRDEAERLVNDLVTSLAHLGEALTLCDEARMEADALQAGSTTSPTLPADTQAAQCASPENPFTEPTQPSAKALGKRRAVEEGHAQGEIKPPLPAVPYNHDL